MPRRHLVIRSPRVTSPSESKVTPTLKWNWATAPMTSLGLPVSIDEVLTRRGAQANV